MGDSFLEREQRFSLGGIELDGGDLDGLAVGGDAEGACVGCCGGEFAVKGDGDGVAVDFSSVDVQRQNAALSAVGDGQIGNGGEVVAAEVLNDTG